ncbi:hypothetical protein BCR44DRAFT_41242 [Catenaria anguillulae PL171]|uniref:Long-chain-fatty-acid--CoA ligase n=1 Tax=Catenaria anguillulae PL171 TaxID=765915 RepID=A0A1Y2I1B9_9FUNG|nr:hypothetical protein BCR44DRAFT_41242 [Catenaria anguillulae PL171]
MGLVWESPKLKPGTVFSIESPGAQSVPGETKPRRAAYLGDKDLSGPPDGCPTIYHVFDLSSRLYGSRPYLGHRPIVDSVAQPYVWQTYAQVRERVANVGSGLIAKGLAPESIVGIYSINCPEWLIACLGMYQHNMICCPLYDTLGDEAVSHIIGQTEMKLTFAHASKLKSILKLRSHFGALKTIVAIGTVAEDVPKLATDAGLEIMSIAELETLGKQTPASETIPKPDDTATICYTSGTTGVPKGAMLTHHMAMSCSHAITTAMDHGRFGNFENGGTHFSYLPLAHVLENTNQWFVIHHGGRVGFYQGDSTKILEDLKELKPSCFVSVPRLLNRIYDKVWAGIKEKGGLAESLFRMAYESKRAGLRAGYNTHMIWDRLVFSKVQAALGGRAKFILTGSAPLSAEVMEFLRICFACEVMEGYGQTEACAAASCTWVGDYETGHVGAPIPCCEVKLIDVPEMNYRAIDLPYPRGEICVRGNNSFKVYFKEPEKSKDAVDKDGWVRTGDVGMWDAKGRLVVIDRVKNIFKLSQGEYVAPEKIEAIYTQHPLCAQAFVYGHSLESCTIGVIVVDEPEFKKWAVSKNLPDADAKTLVGDPAIIKAALTALQEFGKEHGLKGFENIRACYLTTEQFSVEDNTLTPTFKLRRNDAKAKYQKVLDALYRSLIE